jgi:hypothetical protein
MSRNSSFGLKVDTPASDKSSVAMLQPRASSLVRNSTTTIGTSRNSSITPRLSVAAVQKNERLERALAFNIGKLSTANEVMEEKTSCYLIQIHTTHLHVP